MDATPTVVHASRSSQFPMGDDHPPLVKSRSKESYRNSGQGGHVLRVPYNIGILIR
jgi:hypothetical protein